MNSAIIGTCTIYWPAHKCDCKNFFKAVYSGLGLEPSIQRLDGKANWQANDLAMFLRLNGSNSNWQNLASASEAILMARENLVIAVLENAGRLGHVAIVTGGPEPNRQSKYWSQIPIGYWGSYPNGGLANARLSLSFRVEDQPRVRFYAKPILENRISMI